MPRGRCPTRQPPPMSSYVHSLLLVCFVCGCDTFADPAPSWGEGIPGRDFPETIAVAPPQPTTPIASPGRSVPTTTPIATPAIAGNRAVARDAGPADFDDDASAPFGDELKAGCTAPLPTGFCMQRVGSAQAMNNVKVSGTGVTLTNSPSETSLQRIMLSLSADGNMRSGTAGSFTIGALDDEDLAPGVYEGATNGAAASSGASASLSVSINLQSSCFTQSGRFRLDEMATDAQGKLSRLSAVFETRCAERGRESEVARGAVNYQASGKADEAVSFAKTIKLEGDVFRLAYAPTTQRAYGLDAKARVLANIDLKSGQTQYVHVLQVPDAACVDDKRGRLVVVNKGSTLISEYELADLKLAREYNWGAMDANPASTHFQVYCAGDRLFLVDAGPMQGLSVVESLAAEPPKVVDHTAQISNVGGLVFKPDYAEFYHWFQELNGPIAMDGPIRRHAASDLSKLDQVPNHANDPLALGGLISPLLLDARRNLLIAKTTVFDANNLSKRLYTLPGLNTQSSFGLQEAAYALDSERARVATRRHVYELEHYERVSRTASTTADQMFFDAEGKLWFLNVAKRLLRAQVIKAK